MLEELMHIVIVGHVDHGKSTIIGRLLADTQSLPQGKLEQVKVRCEQHSKPFEYAFLLDALKDEQAQGITIDLARCFFRTERRKYLILDAPGHSEFLKNMITGAAHAEAALLVIDINEGIQENSRRHAYMLSMLGIKQLIVLVNKMDLIHYDSVKFNRIVCDYTVFLNQVGLKPIAFIPVSGRNGDSIVALKLNMPWYEGKTVLEALDNLQKALPLTQKPFRMPVQDVYKFTKNQDDRRIICGRIDSGEIGVGDKVVFYPSGKVSAIHSIESWNAKKLQSISAGYSTGFTLTEQIYVKRGHILVKAQEPKPEIASRIQVSLFWLGKSPLITGKDYHLRIGTAKVRARVEKIIEVMNAASLETKVASLVQCHEVAVCVLTLQAPIAFDLPENNPLTSRFVIIDDYDIAGGGIIQNSSERLLKNIHWQPSAITEQDQYHLWNQRGLVVWFTGLSGAGKSTIAFELQKKLHQEKYLTYRLDGDNLRHGLNADLGFEESDRKENVRRIAEVAALFKDAGMITLVSCISPHNAMREYARNCVGSKRFVEVYVKASLETCQRRDVKGLYEKAKKSEIQNFTGISSHYEAPMSPDIILETDEQAISTSTDMIFDYLVENFFDER